MSATPQAPAQPAFHPIPRDEWLASLTESIIEPDLPIIDPHHHLWGRPGWNYEGAELRADVRGGHNVRGTVFLQCGVGYRESGPAHLQPVGETEYVLGVAQSLAKSDPTLQVCQGIVGFADLTLGAQLDEVLEAQQAAADGRFRGIRHAVAVIADDPAFVRQAGKPAPGLLSDPRFRAGVARLGKYQMSFDVWAYHTQMDDLLSLAQAVPDVPIVIDHVGGPVGIGRWTGKRDEVFEQWRGSMRRLAQCPNVYVKLGGLGMRSIGYFFHDRDTPPRSAELAQAWQPWIDECIASFGPSRCMFESNFPVDRCSTSYAVLWNAFKRMAVSFSAAEKAELFSGTARRFYRLEAVA
jgi:L-fuconolactonase